MGLLGHVGVGAAALPVLLGDEEAGDLGIALKNPQPVPGKDPFPCRAPSTRLPCPTEPALVSMHWIRFTELSDIHMWGRGESKVSPLPCLPTGSTIKEFFHSRRFIALEYFNFSRRDLMNTSSMRYKWVWLLVAGGLAFPFAVVAQDRTIDRSAVRYGR